MQIIIMRHSQAVPDSAQDSIRSLTAKGEHDAYQAGNWLVSQGYAPELVLVSPYVRTQQTAAQIHRAAPHWKMEEAEWITPNHAALTVFKQLEQRSESSLMLISHQPLVGNLLNLLVDEFAAFENPFAPATIVILEGDMLAIGAMRVVSMHHPDNPVI